MLVFNRLTIVIFSILTPIIVNATTTNSGTKFEGGLEEKIESCKGAMAVVGLFTPGNSIGRVLTVRNEQMLAISVLRGDPKFKGDQQKLEQKELEAKTLVPVGIYEESLNAGYIYIRDVINILEARADVSVVNTESLISPQHAKQALITLTPGEILTRVHNFLGMSLETKVSQVQLYSLISFVYRLNFVVKLYEKGGSIASSPNFDELIIADLKAYFPGSEGATKLAKDRASKGYLIFPVPLLIRLSPAQKSFLNSAGIIPYELAYPIQDPFETASY